MVLQNVILVQKCVVYDKNTNKILIIKRSDYKPDSAGLWDFPGGCYKYTDDSKEALRRECKEEVNIKLNNFSTIDYYVRTTFDNKGTITFILNYCDDYDIINEEIKLSNEHVEFKWISFDMINEYKYMIAVENLRTTIEPFILQFNK